jgi:chemotaxis protein MotB
MRESLSARNWVAALVALATSLTLAGCVTRGAYDEVVAERDQLRQRNLGLRDVAAGLGVELALRNREVAILEREQQELADEVARWAVLGAIEMHLLADGLHIVMPHDALFASGQANLSAEGRSMIAELVQEIRQQPYQIAVLGFTDNVPVGPDLARVFPSNWELAGARAAGIVRVMQAEGIPVNQLVAISRGEGAPVAPNDTAAGRAQNRRIDVRIRPVVN